MFSLFSRRPHRAARPRRAPLGLEVLYSRDVPSGTVPVIEDFHAEELTHGVFKITGRVTDDQPNGLTVTFGGGMNGVTGQTATTAADGTFSITVFVGTSQIGVATATVKDGDQNVSEEVDVSIDPTPIPRQPGEYEYTTP